MKSLKQMIVESLHGMVYTWQIYRSNKDGEMLELEVESGVHFSDAKTAYADGLEALKDYHTGIFMLCVVHGTPTKDFEDGELKDACMIVNGKIKK